MNNHNFFDESELQSQVKAAIVSKYFWSWAKIIMPHAKKHSNKIAYVDLFAGPGRYKDGTKSTPLLILEKAIEDNDMRNMLVTIFNDANSKFTQDLENSINSLPNIENLKYKPSVYNNEVGEEIVKMFEQMNLIPTLFFVDPWGYKGLSLRLINSVLKNWGCDCIIFFNYNRINMGLNNISVKEHMDALFGADRAEELRPKLISLNPQERELAIVEAIAQSLKDMGGKYPLPFRFKNADGTRTSHHLIFVSKHPLGYGVMKDIMARESTKTEQGVPSFEYNPATKNQPILFELYRPLDDLYEMLLCDFAGQTIQMKDIYENHHIGKPYIKSNYKEILLKLEEDEKIVTDPPAQKRRKIKGKITFGDNVKISFPKW